MLDTLARTGGNPNASNVGKVISEPEPTTALMAPAPIAAAMIARISPLVTRIPAHGPILGRLAVASTGGLGRQNGPARRP